MTPEQFMANFGAIAEAPDGMDRLRGMVLSLGVSGRLKTGSDADEHGEALLGRAAKEREERIADGRARKSKLPKPPEQSRWEFEPPPRWLWTRIGLAFDVAGGLQKSPKRTPKKNHFPYLRVANVQRGRLDLQEILRFELLPGELEKLRLERGDLLVVEGNGSEKEIGRCAVWDGSIENCIHQNHLIRCRPLGGVLPEFVLRFLNSPFGMAKMKSLAVTTSGLYNLSVGKIRNIPIPLPPLAEQKRIVAKVDQLMAMLDGLEQRLEKKRTIAIHVCKASLDSLVNAEDPNQIARAWERVSKNFRVIAGTRDALDDVTDSVLSLAMSGALSHPPERSDTPGIVGRAVAGAAEANRKTRRRGTVEPDVPKSERLLTTPALWTWTRLGAITEISGGVTKGRKLAGRTTTVLPYLRVANVQRWQLELDLMKEIEIPSDEIEKYRLIRGDVLLTEGGDWDKLGRAVVWRDELELCLHQNHVFKVRMVTDEILPEWVEAWCNCRAGRTYFQGAAKQTTNLASINMTQLRNLPIPIPSRVEQAEILAHNRRLRDECHRLQQLLAAHSDAAARVATAAMSPAIV